MLRSEVELDLAGLKAEDVAVEMIFTTSDRRGGLHIQEVWNYKLESFENGIARYSVSVLPERTGMYQVGTRVYPKNAMLPHRQDLPIVKWL